MARRHSSASRSTRKSCSPAPRASSRSRQALTVEKRETFDQVAELYDRARPRYPAELFADLVALAGIPPGGRILEIGPGTGIATLPLAERGFRIVAVELGANLAALARRKLATYSDVEIVVSPFETWQLPDEPFDLVVSATAWHWIDPAVGFPKVARALRPGGSFAAIRYDHVVAPDDRGFAARSHACYRRHVPDEQPDFRLPRADEVTPGARGLEESGLFAAPAVRTYVVDGTYTSEQYVDLLATLSNLRQLEPERRRALLDCIASLIEGEFGGRVRRRILHQLVVAQVRT